MSLLLLLRPYRWRGTTRRVNNGKRTATEAQIRAANKRKREADKARKAKEATQPEQPVVQVVKIDDTLPVVTNASPQDIVRLLGKTSKKRAAKEVASVKVVEVQLPPNLNDDDLIIAILLTDD